MHDFQILFDHAERSDLLDPIYSPYGKLGFPSPPADRPWIYANFVQTLDGIVSLLGVNSSGGDIAQSEEDRWLMDLLRAHADAVLLGLGTLFLEKQLGRPRPRGPIFRIAEPTLQQLRAKLRRGVERNIFVTGTGNLQFSDFAVFDGDRVDTAIITTGAGAERLKPQQATHPHVKIIVSGEGSEVDLPSAMGRLRRDFGVKYLLCEGGPVLYGSMIRAGLVDEKFLTVAPLDVGQKVPPAQEGVPWKQPPFRPTIFSGTGFTREDAVRWHWLSCRKVGDLQFNRYRKIG
jgi:5-amino-6-(5-phosphoribosylamino)uracil reductase